MTSTTPSLRRQPGLELDPNVTVLVRRNGSVQLGWDPESALLLTPPEGVAADTVVAVLRMLDGKHSRPQVVWRACEYGVTPADMSAMLAELSDAGLLTSIDPTPETTSRSVRIHGRGPLSDAIAVGLGRSGLRISRSGSIGIELDISKWRVDFVVLADDMVADPRLVTDLVAARIPHLQVRIRDGKGIVGPMVVPGHTSCLRCADLTRCDYDDEWPHMAAQMLGRVGRATPAAVMATTAVALGQLDIVLSGPPRRAPASLDATLELDLETHRMSTRMWSRHPLCDCWQTVGS
ncbi:hypothetical protein [Antrihabitans cavernicola]|uniref:Cyclodehydratase n=1 Tax=Antrihabitans cavernicola TaxID=2495913 RepID=A0A5A7SDP4_9NOCA|nr:hypothetical protein [Spelaeibacter cavernicola]KAA0024046.1 hypothetical protein FOY51_05625 [Spelaeibacter cavernicola]